MSKKSKKSGAAIRNDATITLKVKDNPFRPKGSAGGRAYKTFALLRSGMTISEAVKKGALRAAIKWAENRGALKLTPAAMKPAKAKPAKAKARPSSKKKSRRAVSTRRRPVAQKAPNVDQSVDQPPRDAQKDQ